MFEDRLTELEERLGRNLRNSSTPPAAEGFSKPLSPSRTERRAAARKVGKHPGAPGKYLAQVADPDMVIAHVPASCRACEDDLAGAEVVDTESRQLFDLPEIHLFVTEHLAERRRCRCGSMTKASFPAAATAPACHGPGVRALACYLTVHQDLLFDRMTELFVDVLGCEASVGALTTMVTEGAHATALFTEEIRELLGTADAVHFDEAGGRVAGRLNCVYSASTELFTLFDCHPKRGRVAMDDLGVIAIMGGVAVHDGWKSYRS